MEDATAEAIPHAALERFLRERLGRADDLAIEGVGPGRSNVTAFVRFGDDRWVVRRPPTGELLPTAHDVLREHRYLTALQGANLPIPEPIVECPDPSVIGAPFYVMTRIDGVSPHDGLPPELATADARRAICEAQIDVLAHLHAIDWRTRGLSARPGDYLERQVRRWQEQIALTATASRLAGLDEITRWVVAHRPPSEHVTVVHGDFEPPNMLYRPPPDAGVAALLDWEMATIGDPFADLLWLLRDWGTDRPGTATTLVTNGPGAPSRGEMLARYEERSGRRVPFARFYLVFALWKDAVILEGLYAGYVEGHAPNPENARYERDVPLLVEQIRALLGDPDDPL
jgi:aminoglycoside phosphotransferase (APT) family kinase protein